MKWIRPAVFGSFDGSGTALGIVLTAAIAHQGALLRPVIALSAVGAAYMAGGEWQSESANGMGASLIMGGATGVSTLACALPAAVLHGTLALALTLAVYTAVTLTIAAARGPSRPGGVRRALLETLALTAVGAGLTVAALAATGTAGG